MEVSSRLWPQLNSSKYSRRLHRAELGRLPGSGELLHRKIPLLHNGESRVVRAPFKPNVLVLPVHKDNSTNLHITNLRKRTPQVSVPLLVDLNGRFLWVNCDQNYLSSTYNAPFCHSTQCSRAGVHYCHKCNSTTIRPGCHNNTCGVLATNPLTKKNAISEIAEDVVSIQSIDHQWATIPQFVFACAPSSLLQGPLPKGVVGVAGLGHTPVALPMQLASHFGFRFALCLSSSPTKNGGIFFGNIPSKIPPRVMAYTPLTIGPQGEYFILVKSIKINNQTVPFNTSLLSKTRGFGGTMISTTTPYTVLERSIYDRFTRFFADQLVGVPRVEAVSPFGLCFNARLLPPTRVGTPNIDFVMQNRNVSWRVFGVDALVRVRPNVSCLAFVDGGTNARAGITIGAYQLEENFIHFDLLRSRVGFIPSRLSFPITCSNYFNFTGANKPTMEFDGMGD
ncbi:hypothetical protein DH2020_026882 [Rehmannia glutinosa]|uniref:Peptidase A1 domain-containing protein n=1 Tax=Rehmannia glutinosa TaxID=99300 RepID=A0ABR0VXG0_REHGL